MASMLTSKAELLIEQMLEGMPSSRVTIPDRILQLCKRINSHILVAQNGLICCSRKIIVNVPAIKAPRPLIINQNLLPRLTKVVTLAGSNYDKCWAISSGGVPTEIALVPEYSIDGSPGITGGILNRIITNMREVMDNAYTQPDADSMPEALRVIKLPEALRVIKLVGRPVRVWADTTRVPNWVQFVLSYQIGSYEVLLSHTERKSW
jgi:hypothetical protein